MQSFLNEKWNYEESVKRVRPMVMNWRNLTVEIVEELYRAREELSARGSKWNDEQNWTGYLNDVGLARTTVHRWLERYVPEERKLLTQEEVEERKRIEAQEKQTERQKSFRRVQEYRRTGVKPEGWRRGTDDKILEEERERDQRFEAKKREMNEAAEKREQEKLDRERQRKESSMKSEALIGAMDAWAEKAAERQEFKEQIRVSHDGGEDTMIDALMDYLDELEDDNRRIQFCYDMIKICRNIAVELQHRQYKEDAGD